MNKSVELSKRENQIAEYIAWGAAQKEVAARLNISVKTVDNTLQHIYKKIGCGKLNELSAWWFCTKFHISFDLSPMARSIGASILLALFVFGEIQNTENFCRIRVRRIARRTKIESII